MKVAQSLKETSTKLDELLVSAPLDHRIRKMTVDAITLLRIATELQSKIDGGKIPFERWPNQDRQARTSI